MTLWELAIGVLVMACGAALQGSIGFGQNLVAAPILVLLEPDVVPVPLLVTAFTITALVTVRERTEVDLEGVRWALVGRIPGAVVGVVAVAVLSTRGLAIAFAVMVLAATVLTAVGATVRRTHTTSVVAGAFSGFAGTTTSIGGPPIALLYADVEGGRLRGTLSAFFLVGVVMSIGLLAVGGQADLDDLLLGLQLSPGVVLGFVASRRLVPVLDRGYTRPIVLMVSAAGALAVLVRALV